MRTIAEGHVEAPRTAVQPAPVSGLVGVQDVLESIGRRHARGSSDESELAFQDAIAAILRGEWDFSLRLLNRLLDSDSSIFSKTFTALEGLPEIWSALAIAI